MADFQVNGFIEGIRYTETSVIVTVSEVRKGYTNANGERVDDSVITWRILYKAYFRKYLANNFSSGQYVKVKGTVLPYAKDHDTVVEGYSVIGQTIDLDAFPRRTVKREMAMVKDSQEHASGVPDLDAFNAPDF